MSDRRSWPAPTMADCYHSAVNNARAAEEKLKTAKARIKALPHGSNELGEAHATVQQLFAEAIHWHEYASYYRKRCEREGDNTVPRPLMRGDFS